MSRKTVLVGLVVAAVSTAVAIGGVSAAPGTADKAKPHARTGFWGRSTGFLTSRN